MQLLDAKVSSRAGLSAHRGPQGATGDQDPQAPGLVKSMKINENRWKSMNIDEQIMKLDDKIMKHLDKFIINKKIDGTHIQFMAIRRHPTIQSSSPRVLELGGRGGSL